MHQGIELHERVANIWLHFARFSLQSRMAVPLSRRKRNRHRGPFPPCALVDRPLIETRLLAQDIGRGRPSGLGGQALRQRELREREPRVQPLPRGPVPDRLRAVELDGVEYVLAHVRLVLL